MSDNREDPSFLEELTLAPSWAKKPAGQRQFEHFSDERDRSETRDRRGGRGRSPGRSDDGQRAWREGHRRDGPAARRPRPPVRSQGAEGAAFEARTHRRSAAPGPFPGGGRTDARDAPRSFAPSTQPPPVEYPVEVRFLPDPKALSVVLHKVAKSHRAYPIRDLARLFLDHPESCEVRIDPRPGVEGVVLHQCARCGLAALHASDLREHALGAHFDDEFSAEEVVGDPPSGTFVCVAKCGFTGKLLAPPNHHSYNERVQEMLRGECRQVSEDEYRSRIETVRDDAAVEQWRQEASRRVLYRRKIDGELAEEAIERPAAETLFVREVLPGLITTPKHVACTHPVAMQLRDRVLGPAVREAWRRELRYPASLFFALRGAFRHKRMYVFRAGDGRGIDFVMSHAPAPLDVQHAVPELKAIFDHLIKHPGTTRAELLQALRVPPDGEGGAAADGEMDPVLKQLAWITERGHVIEYHNGVLALPEERPVFRMVPLHRP